MKRVDRIAEERRMNCSPFHATPENGAFDLRVSLPDYAAGAEGGGRS
jgi:hypothetical protein